MCWLTFFSFPSFFLHFFLFNFIKINQENQWARKSFFYESNPMILNNYPFFHLSFLLSFLPIFLPSYLPSFFPSFFPIFLPYLLPSLFPSLFPSFLPSIFPFPFVYNLICYYWWICVNQFMNCIMNIFLSTSSSFFFFPFSLCKGIISPLHLPLFSTCCWESSGRNFHIY